MNTGIKIILNFLVFLTILIAFRTHFDTEWLLIFDIISATSWALIIQNFSTPIRVVEFI